MNLHGKTRLNSVYRLCICMLHAVSAQALSAVPTQASDRVESVELSFLFLDESPGAFYLKTAGGYELLSKSPYAVAGSKTFRLGAPIEIYKEVPATPSPASTNETEAKKKRIQIAGFTAPDQFAAGLAVLAPESQTNGNGRFKVLFYDAPEKNSNNGVIQLINLGRTSMAVALGDMRLTLEPGETRIMNASTDARNRLKVQIADKLQGEWKLIERRVLFLAAGERMTGVIVYSPSGMKHLYSQKELLMLGGTPPPAHAWLQFKN